MTTLTVASRPASAFEPRELLAAVREVAELADPCEPTQVSTRHWDATRPRSARFANAPSARRICEHLGLPWPRVRELAFLPPVGQSIALGHLLNERQGNWLTDEYADFTLKLVARRLGVETLTPGQYRSERAVMLAADRARGGHLRLPTEDQIAALASTWDRALAHAGLRARAGRGGQAPRIQPVSIIELLDRCYAHHGAEPNSNELEAFAIANGIPLRRNRDRRYGDYVREWKERRRAQRLPVPDGPPPKAQRPDYSRDVGAALPGERRAKKRWDDLDEVVEWVMRYLSELRNGQRSSQRRYADWARGQDGAPWPNAFAKHGGWVAVRDAAQARLRGRQR